MANSAKTFKPAVGELALLPVLIFLIALTRIYYGGGHSPMMVWKGELTFRDTLINLGTMLKLPKDELMSKHRSIARQLEAMDLIEPTDVELESIRRYRRWQVRTAPPGNQRQAPASATVNVH